MPNDFAIKIQNLPELQSALKKYPDISKSVLQKAIEATQFVFQKNTIKDDPVPWKTGNLLQSFRFANSPFKARWYPTARYAPFVEFGTKPHEIRPVNARVLAWPSGGFSG